MDPRSRRRAFKRVLAAWPRGGGLRAFAWAGRPFSVVGDRHRRILLAAGALRSVLRAASPGWPCDLLSPDAGGGAGAAPAARGVAAGAEPILRADGSRKHACARTAAKPRLAGGASTRLLGTGAPRVSGVLPSGRGGPVSGHRLRLPPNRTGTLRPLLTHSPWLGVRRAGSSGKQRSQTIHPAPAGGGSLPNRSANRPSAPECHPISTTK